MNFSLGQDAAYDNGLICGGQLNVFVEPVIPQPRAFIFGARAHLEEPVEGRRPGRVSPPSIIDDREAFANRERFPEADEIYAEEYEDVFPKLTVNETSYLIIVTRGHRDDMRVLRWAVNTPARYIAMIGSKRKVIWRGQGTRKRRHPARGLRKRLRAHGPGNRRDHAGRDCDFRGGGDDRGAPRPEVGLAGALEVHLCHRRALSAS